MTGAKPLAVLWSKAAADAAGSDLKRLNATLIEEATEITSSARDWFLHALRRDGDDGCFACRGLEEPAEWQVFVQRAFYKPLEATAEDGPRPEIGGRVIQFPDVSEGTDNEMFARFEDLVGG